MVFFTVIDSFYLLKSIISLINERNWSLNQLFCVLERSLKVWLAAGKKIYSSITVLAMGRRRGTPPGNCIFFSLIHAPPYPIYKLFCVSFRLIFGKIGTQTAAFGRSISVSFWSRYTVFSMDRDPWVSWTISFHSLSWIG